MKRTSDNNLSEYLSQEFIEVIEKRVGIIVHKHQIDEMKKVILLAAEHFSCTPFEYLNLIKTCDEKSPLIEHLVLGITINETYFFRDRNQMLSLQKNILPNLIALKEKEDNFALRVWSAGCASGEEIYTIAMILSEMLKEKPNFTLSLLGTDINTQVLQKAIAGRFNEWSMRAIPPFYKRKYFTYTNKMYEINAEIKNLVRFEYLNLIDDNYPTIENGTQAQDLILCRNVLIYFEGENIKKVIKKLTNSLRADGYLMLGASDPIQGNLDELNMIHDESIFFQKTSASKVQSSVVKEDHLSPVATPMTHLRKSRDVLQPVPNRISIRKNTVEALINSGSWQEILAIEEGNFEQNKGFLYYAKGVAYANLGQLTAAENILKISLGYDSTNKYCHFAYALTLLELNYLSAAEKALRKTLFLDRQFVEAYYQLGLLLLRNKQLKEGLKCLQNALSIARASDPNLSLPGTIKVTYGKLANILEQEIAIYSMEGMWL